MTKCWCGFVLTIVTAISFSAMGADAQAMPKPNKPTQAPITIGDSFAKAAFMATEALVTQTGSEGEAKTKEAMANAKFEANSNQEKITFASLKDLQLQVTQDSIERETVFLKIQTENAFKSEKEIRDKGGLAGIALADPRMQAIANREATCREDFEKLLKDKVGGELPASCKR
jgi:hypothetical protein